MPTTDERLDELAKRVVDVQSQLDKAGTAFKVTAWWAGVLILLVVITLGHSTFYEIQSRAPEAATQATNDGKPAEPDNKVFYILVTALVGAMLKLLDNYWERRRRQKIAGNLALPALLHFERDWRMVKREFDEHWKELSEQKGVIELIEQRPWLAVMHVPFLMSPQVKIDYENLDFLTGGGWKDFVLGGGWIDYLTGRGRENSSKQQVLFDIINSEERHQHLTTLVSTYASAAADFYKLRPKFDPSKVTTDPESDVTAEPSALVEANLAGKLSNTIKTLVDSSDSDCFRKAVEGLRKVMIARFRKKNVIDIPPEQARE